MRRARLEAEIEVEMAQRRVLTVKRVDDRDSKFEVDEDAEAPAAMIGEGCSTVALVTCGCK
jgi:hypothetical protein